MSEQQIPADMADIQELESTKTTYVGKVIKGKVFLYVEDSPATRKLRAFLRRNR